MTIARQASTYYVATHHPSHRIIEGSLSRGCSLRRNEERFPRAALRPAFRAALGIVPARHYDRPARCSLYWRREGSSRSRPVIPGRRGPEMSRAIGEVPRWSAGRRARPGKAGERRPDTCAGSRLPGVNVARCVRASAGWRMAGVAGGTGFAGAVALTGRCATARRSVRRPCGAARSCCRKQSRARRSAQRGRRGFAPRHGARRPAPPKAG
jgi:hypothetical protein